MAIYPELQGRVAVVTGGNTGIGAAIVRRFVEQGTAVAVVGFAHPQDGERLAAEMRARGCKTTALVANLTREDDVGRCMAEATDALGPVDILVNCAGGYPARRLVVDTTEAEWDAIVDLNLKSAFLCSRAVLPGMIERRWGRIINISSEAGRMPVAFTAAHYAASKAGLLGFTRHLAREVATYGITVNATAPGTTYSERARRMMSAAVEAELTALTPIGRIAESDEQAGAVVFLASDAANYITGATLDISGGKIML